MSNPEAMVTPGVNFINILHSPFIRADPKIPKKDSQVTSVFLMLLGSACILLAVYKTLVKSTPEIMDQLHQTFGAEQKFTEPRSLL